MAIKTLALIFASLTLIKFLFLAFNPKGWIKLSDKVLNEGTTFTWIYAILALITGYYLFQEVNIIQVGAVMLFTTLLIGLAFLPHAKVLAKLRKDASKDLFQKNWLSFAIWIVISVWILLRVL